MFRTHSYCTNFSKLLHCFEYQTVNVHSPHISKLNHAHKHYLIFLLFHKMKTSNARKREVFCMGLIIMFLMGLLWASNFSGQLTVVS